MLGEKWTSDTLENHSSSSAKRTVRAFVLAILALMFFGIFSGIIGNVKASNGTLLPSHSDCAVDTDTPPNSLFDELIVNVSVDVTASGRFDLTVDLYDNSGVFLIESQSPSSGLSLGIQTVQSVFSGNVIRGLGFDGPYQVDIKLFDNMYELLDTDSYVTNPYFSADFQSPPTFFAPPHSDYGLDSDGNTLYEYLITSVNLSVSVSGNYEINGSLFDSSGVFFITSGFNYTFLDVGTQTVDIAFPGHVIRSSGFSGTYKIQLRLFDDSSKLLDRGTYFTSVYSANYFETSPTPPDVESPIITDERTEPNPQAPGEDVRISTNVEDNVQVYGVWAEVSGPNGDAVGNYTMNYDSVNDEYWYNRSFSDLGTYRFNIWVNDTSDNWNSTSGSFEIREEKVALSFLEEYWWLLIVVITVIVVPAVLLMKRKQKVAEIPSAPLKEAPPSESPLEASPEEELEPVSPLEKKSTEALERLVTCPSCGDTASVKTDMDLLKTRCKSCGSVLQDVAEGYNYLIVDDNPAIAYEEFKRILRKEVPGLCLSTTFPEKLRKRFDVTDADLYWLSDTTTDPAVKTLDPKRLDFEMTRVINNFLKKSPKGAVMIDGIESLIVENGFDRVFRFVKKIIDLASVGDATTFIPLAPSSLAKDEFAVLQKEFDRVQILSSTPPP